MVSAGSCSVVLAVVALGLCRFASVARADIGVHATLNPQRAEVGEPLQLAIDINGAQNVAAPKISVDGFDVRYIGPSTQISIVNGQMNASVQHRYSLLPLRQGHFTIGPFAIAYEGKQYSTAPFNVDIVGAGQPQPPVAGGQPPPGQASQGSAQAGALRLTLSVPKTELYLHERLPVDVNLYVGPVRAGDVQYPTLPGDDLSVDKFTEPSQRQQLIDAQTFQVLHFQTTVIPLRAGALTLGPATLMLNVYDRRGRGGFFDDVFAQPRAVSLHSDPLTLTVLPLPEEGRPASFSGAVGTFTMDVNAAPTELTAGDPITMRMTLSGSGNLADATAPALSATDGFRIYEPHPAKTDSGVRSYEQVLIPSDASVHAVPPVRFSYFDPQARRYQTLESQPIALVVRAPANAPHADIVAGGAALPRVAPEEKFGRDIVFIKDDPGRLAARGDRWYRSPYFVAWQPVPLLLVVAALWYDRRRQRLRGDIRFARFTRAGKQARQGLSEAERALTHADRPAFYDVVSRTMQEYLAAKLDLPPGGIDAEAVQQRGVPVDCAQLLRDFFATCEHVRFAPSAGDGDMRGTLSMARDIIKRLERERRLGAGVASRTQRTNEASETAHRVGLAAVLLLFTCADVARASGTPAGPQTTFFHANALYKDGQYSAAAEEYEQLLKSGVASGNVYFNLANALFKAGDKGNAILNYERARRMLPNDPDVAANLAYAQSLTGAEPCTPGVWDRLAFPVAQRVSIGGLVWASSAVYTTLCVVVIIYRLWPRRPRWLSYIATALAITLVIATTSLARRVVADEWERHAVVIADGDTPARFEPAENGTVHYTLKQGSLVQVLGVRDKWSQVARCDGRRGWVTAAAVAALGPS